jgi:hypothetical protein
MVSSPTPEAEEHSHAHTPAQANSSLALSEAATSAGAESPAPCVMTTTCGMSGIAQARITLDSPLAHQETSSLWLAASYSDPIAPTKTPPPRA